MKINDNQITSIESGDDAEFSTLGCDNCDTGLGEDIYDTDCHFKTDNGYDSYQVDLCHICIYAFHNADELDKDCKNKFNI